MAKLIIYDNGDGVSVVSPAPGVSVEDAIEYAVPKGADYKVVEDTELPADRTFRDAWTMKGIDVNKAKQVWLDTKVRPPRDKRLAELDVEWMVAMENGEAKKASAIAASKQQLRDVTERKDFAKIKKVEDIQNFWPEILEG